MHRMPNHGSNSAEANSRCAMFSNTMKDCGHCRLVLHSESESTINPRIVHGNSLVNPGAVSILKN